MVNSWDAIVGTERYQQNLERLEKIAKAKGYRLNSDEKRVEKVIGLMTMNYVNTRQNFCPCKQTHPIDIKSDTTCPCPELDEEIASKGNCFCRLFFGYRFRD